MTPERIAEMLVDDRIKECRPLSGGGNNRVFRVESQDGRLFALKFYPRQEADPRDRQGAEWAALSLLSEEEATPRAIAKNEGVGASLLSWVEGVPPLSFEPADIDHMADFLRGLERYEGKAAHIGPASAACLAPSDAAGQFDERLVRFSQIDHAALRTFLAQTLAPLAEKAKGRLAACAPGKTVSSILSPSDFGPHNSLRRSDGSLAFLDFEYFGWDDPVKAVSDVMLHPGANLPPDSGLAFLDRLTPWLMSRDPDFLERFRLLFPMFGCIWCLILLNEFLPERWERRLLAKRHGYREDVLQQQLARGQAMAQRVEEWLDG